MQTGIRLVAQHYDVATGKTLGESILGDAALSKAATLKELEASPKVIDRTSITAF